MKKNTLLLTLLSSILLTSCTKPVNPTEPSPTPSKEPTPTVSPTPSVSPTPTPSVIYSLNLENVSLEVDEKNYSEITIDEHQIGFSKVEASEEGLIKILDRGIILNKSPIKGITSLTINFLSMEAAKLYYGNQFLPCRNYIELDKNNEITLPENSTYFVIQSEGESVLGDLKINYTNLGEIEEHQIPSIYIDTNNVAIASRTKYVDCTIGVEDPNDPTNDLEPAEAQIKRRGNSSSFGPKYSYRIKFASKQKMLGLKKNKSWVLLCDYLDGSKMHNYSALSFAKLVRENSNTFAVNPIHVNVYLNNQDIGIYLFCEHVNEKAGRLNIEQDKVWEKSFDEMNIYFERNIHTDADEARGLCQFPTGDKSPFDYDVFSLKYPTYEDFYETLPDGSIDEHNEEYEEFHTEWTNYMEGVCNAFNAYLKDYSKIDEIDAVADLNSLAMYGITDQAFEETDHHTKSLKMYKLAGDEKVKFGPNWDYDSCVEGLHFSYSYEDNPYTNQTVLKGFTNVWFGEKWGYRMYKDANNGRKYFINIWKDISSAAIENYIEEQLQETERIASYFKSDASIWMENKYYCVFDNLTFHHKWIRTEMRYLKNLYNSL